MSMRFGARRAGDDPRTVTTTPEKRAEYPQVPVPAPVAPPPMPTGPSDASLVTRRCDYMEEQLRRQNALLQDQAILIKSLQEGGESGTIWLNAKCALKTPQFDVATENIESHVKADPTPSSHVRRGSIISVCYPMVQVTLPEETQVLMRRRIVDSVTGQMSSAWVVVYATMIDDSTHHRYVSGFSV